MIFTAPSSARGNLDKETVPEPQGKHKKMPSKCPPIAVQAGMDGQVTAQAIAYAAVQVPHSPCCSSSLTHSSKLHFALCDTTHWMSHYNGFNYEEFYEFVIDFFKANQTPEGIAASRELYNWWNKYIPYWILIFTPADTSPERCSQDPLLLEQPHLPQHSSRCLQC